MIQIQTNNALEHAKLDAIGSANASNKPYVVAIGPDHFERLVFQVVPLEEVLIHDRVIFQAKPSSVGRLANLVSRLSFLQESGSTKWREIFELTQEIDDVARTARVRVFNAAFAELVA